ncbi:hypothetical protein AX15_001284 [Amanita polypyramis BW_CC]|nr:hypothetical protein AX15_001284 [Amanita polypyramis BW_CC]
MAKSTRSKVKRAYRAKKRESGVYAVTEAARLRRLNAKLTQTSAPEEGKDDVAVEESGMDDDARAADDTQRDEKQTGWVSMWYFSVLRRSSHLHQIHCPQMVRNLVVYQLMDLAIQDMKSGGGRRGCQHGEGRKECNGKGVLLDGGKGGNQRAINR